MHRFFLRQRLDKDIVVIKERALLHQIKTVLRLKKGERVVFFTDAPEEAGFDVECELRTLEAGSMMFLVRARRENHRESRKMLTLFCSLLRRDKLEFVLQKGTEIGIAAFVLVLAQRSEKKQYNMSRAELIIKEAAEQSGRAALPAIVPPMPFARALEEAVRRSGKVYVADTAEHDNMVRGAGDRFLHLFIGPEGGWDEAERALMRKAHVESLSLGRLTLRAETAALVASYTLLWL